MGDSDATPSPGVESGPGNIRSVAQVFVTDLGVPTMDTEDFHHLTRVLRVRTGETVVVADGRGSWRACTFVAGPPSGSLRLESDIFTAPHNAPRVAVAFVPAKGDRPEWVVQKLTEVGVDGIIVLRSARAVVRWDADRASKQLDRLRRIAREAASQSRRAWLPDVSGVRTFSEMLRNPESAEFETGIGARGISLAHPGGGSLSLERPLVAVGPEGGWDESELGSGLPLVDLGPNILRAETAALAAGLFLCGLRDRLVLPSQA